jgi:hypothetical protein
MLIGIKGLGKLFKTIARLARSRDFTRLSTEHTNFGKWLFLALGRHCHRHTQNTAAVSHVIIFIQCTLYWVYSKSKDEKQKIDQAIKRV